MPPLDRSPRRHLYLPPSPLACPQETFLRNSIKVDGKKGKLEGKVEIKREGGKVIVESTNATPYAKRYFKYLAKKYLKKLQLRDCEFSPSNDIFLLAAAALAHSSLSPISAAPGSPRPCPASSPSLPPLSDLRVLSAPANKHGYELRYFKMAAADADEE